MEKKKKKAGGTLLYEWPLSLSVITPHNRGNSLQVGLGSGFPEKPIERGTGEAARKGVEHNL